MHLVTMIISYCNITIATRIYVQTSDGGSFESISFQDESTLIPSCGNQKYSRIMSMLGYHACLTQALAI
jgi:hypothetical protein